MIESDLCSYPLDGDDLMTMSESELVKVCVRSFRLQGADSAVYRVAKTAVVKVDFDISLREASNMIYVAEYTNGQLRLPKVYRSFACGGKSYTVMQYVEGECLNSAPWVSRDPEQRASIIRQAADAILVLRSLRGKTPGPIESGSPIGGLFSIYGANKMFSDCREMEKWLDQKLKLRGGGSLKGRFDTLVMCHMDIALRNMKLDGRGQLWFLDWAWSGFYPPEFEIASLHHKEPGNFDYEFSQALLQELGSAETDEVLTLLLTVYEVNDGPYVGSHLLES